MVAHFPFEHRTLLRGELVSSFAVPRSYVPVWFTITTPMPVLLLGVTSLALMFPHAPPNRYPSRRSGSRS